MLLSKPRTKFYACQTVYAQLARDLLGFRIHKGRNVAEFESAAARHFGCRHAVATPMARVAIYLTLRYFLRHGQQVITSPYTLAEVINMITCAGGEPHFVDVERENGHLDPDCLPSNSDNVGAILVTHLHGIPARMDRITDYARARGIPVVEDAAQSAGAKFGGRFVGTIGNAGVLSFGMLKQLNALYGGMVLTDDANLAEFLREELAGYRKIPVSTLLDKLAYLCRLHCLTTNPVFSFGMFPLLRHGVLRDIDWINRMVAVEVDLRLKRNMDDWYHHRMSACQARMLTRQLGHLENNDQERIRNAEGYRARLDNIDDLIVPCISEGSHATFAHFPVQVPDAANVLRWFNYYGQDVVAQHLFNCADLPCFQEFHRPCPRAAAVANALILLPTYPGFGERNVERNATILRRYFEMGQPQFENRNLLQL